MTRPDSPAPFRRVPSAVRRVGAHRPGGRSDRSPAPGVDLGTANIVVSVVDSLERPVAGGWVHSRVVRDGARGGLGRRDIGRSPPQARCRAEARAPLRCSVVSIPPGISDGDIKVFSNVANAAELDVTGSSMNLSPPRLA